MPNRDWLPYRALARGGLIVVVALFLGGGAQQSPDEQTRSGNNGAPSEDHQPGSEANPIAVKLLNTGESDAAAAQEAKRIAKKDAFDKSSTEWTIALTGVLGFATILQFGALFYQGFWLRRSVKVAERALTELERPWVFVHIKPGTQRYIDAFGKECAEVLFEIANYGKAPAIIEDCNFGAVVANKPETWLHREYLDTLAPDEKRTGRTFFVGEPAYKMVLDFSVFNAAGEALLPVPGEGENVFFAIYIKYTGNDPSVFYETMCVWIWDFKVRMWVRDSAPEHNRRT